MMTLQEAIEEIEKATLEGDPWTALDIAGGDPEQVAHGDYAIATILNAIIDGTMIPSDAVFQVREGYEVEAYKRVETERRFSMVRSELTEALEIRSADEVRREGYLEGHNDGYRAALSRPQPKGVGDV